MKISSKLIFILASILIMFNFTSGRKSHIVHRRPLNFRYNDDLDVAASHKKIDHHVEEGGGKIYGSDHHHSHENEGEKVSK